MTPKFYPLLQQCIEDGVARGYAHAHKHDDDPGSDAVRLAIYDAIMFEIHEWFDFPDPPAT